MVAATPAAPAAQILLREAGMLEPTTLVAVRTDWIFALSEARFKPLWSARSSEANWQGKSRSFSCVTALPGSDLRAAFVADNFLGALGLPTSSVYRLNR